jgi:RNA polymerase sigma factor (sigma-70 family)
MRDSQTLDSARPTVPTSAGPVHTASHGHARLIEWFGRWCGPIRSWIEANTGVPSGEVDDLTQEVFLRLLRYSGDVLVQNPQGYLFRVASNVVLEWRQRCRVRMPHDDSWLHELPIEEAQEPENALERAWQSQYLRGMIDRLPARQRKHLLLHITEGMTYKQIAQAQGLTYRIVLRDLTRAYATLRKYGVPQDIEIDE